MSRSVQPGQLVFLPSKNVPHRAEWDDEESVSTRYDVGEELERLRLEGCEESTEPQQEQGSAERSEFEDPVEPSMQFVSFAGAAAYARYPSEVRCRVLFDHFPEQSILHLSCLAGETVVAVAEENAVCCYEKDGNTIYARLPHRISFAKSTTCGHGISGIVPTEWIVPLHIYNDSRAIYDGGWYFGVTSPADACRVLARPDARCGDFVVVMAPAFGDGDPKNTPFLLIVVMKKVTVAEKKTADASNALPSDLEVKIVSVERDALGRYRVAEDVFPTLFGLVLHYSQQPTAHLPRLNVDTLFPKALAPLSTVPPPPMFGGVQYTMLSNCAELAVEQYMEVTQPSLQAAARGYLMGVVDAQKKTPSTVVQMCKEALGEKQPPSSQSIADDYRLDPMHVVVDRVKPLGAGQFGSVYRGILARGVEKTNVAVKEISIPPGSPTTAWTKELAMLKLCSHPNIVRFFGFYEKERRAYLVLELVDQGNLNDYLQARKAAAVPLSEVELAEFALQIVRGCGFLHSLSPAVVHADLSARNILISTHPVDQCRVVLKVADFGLSKMTSPDMFSVYDDPSTVPFKWLAPEALAQRQLSTKSDVWSIGIVFIEMCQCSPNGTELYGRDKNDILSYLSDGCRMRRPETMPHWMYQLCVHCWHLCPADRPSCRELESSLLQQLVDFDPAHVDALTAWQRIVESKRIEKAAAAVAPRSTANK